MKGRNAPTCLVKMTTVKILAAASSNVVFLVFFAPFPMKLKSLFPHFSINAYTIEKRRILRLMYNGYPYYYVQYVPTNTDTPYNPARPQYAQRNPQQKPSVQQLMQTIRSQHSNLFTQLQQAGVNQQLVATLFFYVVNFTRNQANINRSASQIYTQFQRETPWFNTLVRSMNLPLNTIDQVLTRVIEITLNLLRGSQPSPGPAPAPTPTPGQGWANWESLGGTLVGAPTVSSWSANRLDVFGRGTDNALYHIWWDGTRWSSWENLGGTLTSSPAAVSWGPNRIDVFGRGTDNALYHKWWDGSSWSDWENLGGTLTSGPAVSSRRANQLDVFVRGTGNRTYKRTWNGSRWEEWEDLGGNLNSEPAAISWGPNRIDLFARGQNNDLIHKWWDGSRWSDWESLGGTLTSAPTVSSPRANQLDVFVRGTGNRLYKRSWNGSRWDSWESIGGNLTSAPAAVSWGPSRTDIFAKGQNNELIHTWQGQ